jgi:hypothetical protein
MVEVQASQDLESEVVEAMVVMLELEVQAVSHPVVPAARVILKEDLVAPEVHLLLRVAAAA